MEENIEICSLSHDVLSNPARANFGSEPSMRKIATVAGCRDKIFQNFP
jgi:hypothetical protein